MDGLQDGSKLMQAAPWGERSHHGRPVERLIHGVKDEIEASKQCGELFQKHHIVGPKPPGLIRLRAVGGERGDLTAPGSSELQHQMAETTDPHNRHMGHRRDLLIHKRCENCDLAQNNGPATAGSNPSGRTTVQSWWALT
ncbi:hypothetical protein SynROS8604_02483 [Synechococcus sp. ROS8604]|nr:hypothetical protein SynROS8604_02483 [Synechococcus sp. ROS8604]